MKASDYQIVADIIRRLPNAFGLRNTVAKHFAEELAKLSPRFKKDVFLATCGYKPEEDEE